MKMTIAMKTVNTKSSRSQMPQAHPLLCFRSLEVSLSTASMFLSAWSVVVFSDCKEEGRKHCYALFSWSHYSGTDFRVFKCLAKA